MTRPMRPNDWTKRERRVLWRADFRCECGTFYDCNGTHHHGRCPNVSGQRYAHNKRRIALRVVQIKRGSDWRHSNLVALCLPCYAMWDKDEAEMVKEVPGDGLFDFQA